MTSPDYKNFHNLGETRVKILNIRNCDSFQDIFPKHLSETQTTEEIRYGQNFQKEKGWSKQSSWE